MSRRSRDSHAAREYTMEPKTEQSVPPPHAATKHKGFLPSFHRSHPNQVTPGIAPEGESGRKGIHPFKFLKICARSSSKVSALVNVLMPFIPVAIAWHFARPKDHLTIFVLNFIAMVPSANLLGFAGQELARKLPKVFGVILEITLGSIVEIILFIVLISQGDGSVQLIKAAILGSILANLLLCLGMCFLVGGLKRQEQSFHEAISEVGSGLMLVAGMGLIIPSLFNNTLSLNNADVDVDTLKISRATAIMLLVAFLAYLFFQAKSHHGLYDEILEADEHKDADRHKDLAKAKLTFTECMLALAVALACVSLHAVFLVEQIHHIVTERHISDAFVGLIMVPVVEKAAEHLTAIDEAYDNQANFALAHVLGASIQTALLNTPIVVMVGWGLGYHMDLDFEVFDSVVLILAIIVVGNFLRDGKSNYLEGCLCVIVYIIIAICAYYYPNPVSAHGGGEESTTTETHERLRMMKF